MQIATDRPQAPTAIRTDLGAIFVSLELSRSTWLITSLSPGGGEKMSKHTVRSGDVAGLRTRFSQLKDKVQVRMGQIVPIIVIQEAGLDGFWIHRLLQDEGVESHVVDPASIATSRRRRRAKSDKIDGEALVRALLAYKRGEPRVCAMVRAPTPHEEDRRRICRERKILTAERVEHVNRIKGLLFAQGVSDYEPLLRKRRARLEELRTGDGRPLPEHLKAQIGRELDRLELTLQQIKSVETERDAMLSSPDEGTPAPGAMLKSLKGIGPEFAGVLWSEGLFRSFSNRRQVASYAGLAPTPWRSGSVAHEQGVSKAGNPRLRPQRADGRVRLLTRKGINFASRFSQVVAALTVLPVRSCLIDGEAVVCNESGLAVFDLLRGYRDDAAAVLCAFDLLELDGKDLRRMPIEERKRILAKLLSHPHEGIRIRELDNERRCP
jgi:transposase